MTKLNIHFGYPKTGTTSLQNMLARSRKSLDAHRVLFPETIDNRHRVLQLIGSDGTNQNLNKRLNVSSSDERKSRIDSWVAGLAEVAADYDSVILSEETLATRAPEELAEIHSVLAPHFSEVHVYVGFRQHESFAISDYMQRVKATFNHASFRHYVRNLASKDFMLYSQVLERFDTIFGPENVHPIVYDAANSHDFNKNLLASMGVEAEWLETPTELYNKMPNIEVLFLKQFFNRRMEQMMKDFDGKANGAVHDAIIDALGTVVSAAKITLPTKADLLDSIPRNTKRQWDDDWTALQASLESRS